MKQQLLLLIALLFGYNSFCQTTIYSENCSTPSATTSVATYTNWQRYGTQSYSGNADVRTTVPSTTYTGASGGGNIFITNALNTNCTISGISTIGYTNICLQFGILKTTNGSNGSQLAVEYSTDGTTWSALSFTLGTGSGSSNVWSYIQPTCSPCGSSGLPSVSNLRIRFRMATVATGLQFRIDDIRIVGTTAVVLPLTIVSFTAAATQNTNTIQWTTLSEDGIQQFIVQKSVDASEWIDFATIEPKGNLYFRANYQYEDLEPQAITYYRLAIIDFDGGLIYSRVVGVRANTNNTISIQKYNISGEALPDSEYSAYKRVGRTIIVVH